MAGSSADSTADSGARGGAGIRERGAVAVLGERYVSVCAGRANRAEQRMGTTELRCGAERAGKVCGGSAAFCALVRIETGMARRGLRCLCVSEVGRPRASGVLVC